MTAGSGIVHQEMPKGDQTGRMHGFQLWANLPAALKMTTPRYQEVKTPEIPEITDDDGTQVRLVCGHFWGKTGPVEGIAADPTYIDVSVPPGKRKALPVETSRHAFAYVFGRIGTFCNASQPLTVPTESLGWWPHATPPAEWSDRACAVRSRRRSHGPGRRERHPFPARLGTAAQEPVAWYGPIVMNTQAEVRQAFDELEQGTFLKQSAADGDPRHVVLSPTPHLTTVCQPLLGVALNLPFLALRFPFPKRRWHQHSNIQKEMQHKINLNSQ